MKGKLEMTRRSFIRTGVVTGAAATLGTYGAAAGEEAVVVRIGIVGVGNRGTGLLNTLLLLQWFCNYILIQPR